ncbi:MAG: exo-alpha-sialidase, partial [Candidatus Omnitrophica bacterium]|nr:exo-alpha-sialidase [Candidatus Omnitrophota bacterium]
TILSLLISGCGIAFASDDPALIPPPINHNPGPEYGDDTRVFQGIPGLERASNGRLWAVWYGGGETEGPENYVMVVTSGDDGKTWSDLEIVIDPPGEVRAYDPTLWIDPTGKLWLFWAQSYGWWDGRSGVWTITTDEPEAASPEWSEPRRLCNGIMMNKPTALSTGEWLLPAAVWAFPPKRTPEEFQRPQEKENGSNVIVSKDQGETWDFLGMSDVPERSCDEHLVVEKQDGTLWQLVRTQYGVGESFSEDRGKTWSEGRKSETVSHIPHARFFVRRLNSGNLLLVKHNPPDGKTRSHLTAFISEDDGQTWSGGLVLDERNGVSYPDGVQADNGTLYIIYDYDRRGEKKILMCTFTEGDALAGRPVSGAWNPRIQVNQATGSP